MIDIKLIKHKEHIEEIISLHNSVFHTNVTPEIWKWKHLDNPFTCSDPSISVALYNDRVVGANCFMPLELSYGKNIIKAVQSCDSMLLPEYRGKGLFFKIFRLGAEYYKEQGTSIIYGFPNDNSMRPLLKEGFMKVWQIDELIKILRPEKVISGRVNNAVVRKAISYIYEKVYQKNSNKYNRYFVNATDSYPSILDDMNNLCSNDCLDISRSEIFYKWRIDNNPLYDFEYLYIEYEGKLLGYALIGGRKAADAVNFGYIVDCLVLNNDIEVYNALIERAVRELSHKGYDCVITWEMHNKILKQQLVREYGFQSNISFPYRYLKTHGNNFYYIVYNMNQNDYYGCDIYDGLNWKLSLIFSDAI
jgi:hypothetical protein